MQNQSAQWLNVRRDRPDWMMMWGWGAMNPTAVKEAAKINFPMDKFIGIWWSGGDDDAAAGGEAAKGYLVAQLQRRRRQLPGDPGHQEARRRQGQEPGREGQGRRELLQSRRLQLGAGRRSDPQRAEDIRQEGGDRRGRAARLRDAQHHRRALEGDRPRGLRGADHERDLRRPQRPSRRPTCSNGTAPSGSRSPTGSRR